MSADLAAEVVERELGRPPDEVFVEWDPEPIAAASIGQVHRAVVVDPATGDERAVAVKVQYPGVGEAIEADLANADLLGTLLRQGFGGLDPTEMVAEIKSASPRSSTTRARRATSTRSPTSTAATRSSTCPTCCPPVDVRSADERARRRLDWARSCRWDQHQRDLAGEALFRFVFRSLYRMRAFNGDPHPGNYLFHGDGQVTFLDFGLVRYFSDDEMDTFASMVKAAAVDHDAAEFRRDRRGRRAAAPERRCRPRPSATTSRTSTTRCARPRHDVDPRVRQHDRASHVRPDEPDRPVRHRAAGVRVHPADQPRPVRAARRPAGHAATTGGWPRSCGRSSTARRRPTRRGRGRLARGSVRHHPAATRQVKR